MSLFTLAARLGLPPSRDTNGIRAMLPEILRRSGLALVLADGQNLLHYRYKGGNASLVEWIVTFAREGIPVALCVDPQLIPELGDLAKRRKLAWQPFDETFRRQWRRLETPASALETEAAPLPAHPASREADAVGRMAESLLPDVGAQGWKAIREFVMRHAGNWGGTTAALMDVVGAANAQARLTGRESAIYADLQPALLSLYESANALESGRPESEPAASRMPRRGATKVPARQRVAAIRTEATDAFETIRPAGRQTTPEPSVAEPLSEAGQSRFNGSLSTQFYSRRAGQDSLLTDAEAELAAGVHSTAAA